MSNDKQSPKRLKLTKRMVKDALEKMRGNVALTAQSLGVSRQTVYSYMTRYPDLKDIRADAVEFITDVAEGHLETMVLQKDQRAIEFWLRYRGKARGYTLSNDVKMETSLQLPADVLEMMREHNIAMADVARELEAILREAGHGDAKDNG
jgi:hypothetical protein